MVKKITVSDRAYEKLEALKRDDESVSDVVCRLASDVTLAEYEGVLDRETADELDEFITQRRN